MMEVNNRVGVFICRCGTEIAKVIDTKSLKEYAENLPEVVFATEHDFLCFKEGLEFLKDAIEKYKLNRIVIAACSPRLHEITFRKVLEKAGLNPFLLEIANIREQCAWVHSDDPEGATEKAKHLLKAAVLRATTLEEIEEASVPASFSVLVIGGGIAGITAALKLAEYGFQVYLVEKNATLGGKVLQLGTVFPTEDCGVCMVPYVLERHRKCLFKYVQMVLTHPRIKVFTKSVVENVEGFIGNFKVTIRKNPRYVDEEKCVACGICEEVCPIEVPNEFDLGLSTRKAIYLPSPHVVPRTYIIDENHCNRCGECVKVCPFNAINLDEKPQRIELNVGAIIVATGFKEFEPKGIYGYGTYPDVITQLMLARMLDPSGPTGGRLVRVSDGKPPSKIVMIQCVGSRDPKTNPYCSNICCTIALKHARNIKELYPGVEVTIVYKDIRVAGKNYEKYYTICEKLGVRFVKGEVLSVVRNPESEMFEVELESYGKRMKLFADLLVLSCGFTPSNGARELAEVLNINLRQDGFFVAAHPKLAPIETNVNGIFLCGAAQGPVYIAEAVNQAIAASSKVAMSLAGGNVKTYLTKAIVNENYCIGCRVCEMSCPFNAVKVSSQGISRVIETMCRECGICAAECPAGAMQLRNYRDEQINATITGVLKE